MQCETCKKNQATVHIIKFVNGAKREIYICESCAKETKGLGVSGEMESPLTFQNILSGLVDYINQSSQNNRNPNDICPVCGTTYDEFKQRGLMGCSNCYKNFGSTLMPVIKRVQGNTEHIGKVPLKAGKVIMDKKRISDLKDELQKAVAIEAYEKAAELRDLIKQLQNVEVIDN